MILSLKSRTSGLSKLQEVTSNLFCSNSKSLSTKILLSLLNPFLIINTDEADIVADKVRNAGSVFIGSFSCESAGDYASGTNHTLPTNGFAKNFSGVSTESFLKKITFQKISADGIINLGPTIELMAEAESLMGHKNAVSVRLKSLKNG